MMEKTVFRGWRMAGLAGIMAATMMPAAAHAAPQVIELTQTGCQFLEPEGKDYGYQTRKKADCEAINGESGAERLAQSNVMRVKAGDFIFRVANENVPYELGFWVRDVDYDWTDKILNQKISVSGGGLRQGKTKDYAVTLTPGEYVYSCPLNPTPNYRLIVE
ncbi:MAG: hypothetical protein ABID63_06190 [Pseudomonadota bacterium]